MSCLKTRKRINVIMNLLKTGSYRKFFHHVVDMKDLCFLKKREWTGQFELVSDIYIIEVNNHDYKAVQ